MAPPTSSPDGQPAAVVWPAALSQPVAPRRHTPMPAALVAHLKAIGRWNDDGITRRAQARPCTSCGVVCMTGMTAEPCAVTVRADSVPIDATGELLALMGTLHVGGTDRPRRTYRLRWYAGRGRYELDLRDRWMIRRAPAGSVHPIDGDRVVVLAEHVCGASALPVSTAAGRALAQIAREAHTPKDDPDKPPPF